MADEVYIYIKSKKRECITIILLLFASYVLLNPVKNKRGVIICKTRMADGIKILMGIGQQPAISILCRWK